MPNSIRSFVKNFLAIITITLCQCTVFELVRPTYIDSLVLCIYRPISSSSSEKKSSSEVRVTWAVPLIPLPFTSGAGAISNSVSPSSRETSNRSWPLRCLNSLNSRYKYAATPIVTTAENITRIVPSRDVWWRAKRSPTYTGIPNYNELSQEHKRYLPWCGKNHIQPFFIFNLIDRCK